jgi:hypothetical protein
MMGLRASEMADLTVDFSGDALERHASHQVAGSLAGWAG